MGLPLCRHAVSMNSRCLSCHYHLPLLHRGRIPISVKLKQIVKQRILGFETKKKESTKSKENLSELFSLQFKGRQRTESDCAVLMFCYWLASEHKYYHRNINNLERCPVTCSHYLQLIIVVLQLQLLLLF